MTFLMPKAQTTQHYGVYWKMCQAHESTLKNQRTLGIPRTIWIELEYH